MAPGELNAVLYVPGPVASRGHGSQAASDSAPTTMLKVPAGHGSHSLAPGTVLYVPAAHASHTSADAAPTTALNAPAAHGSHEAAPGATLKLPAGHESHEVAPSVLNVPAAHTSHRFGPRRLQPYARRLRDEGVAVPAGHSSHAVAPDSALKVPAWHSMHVDARRRCTTSVLILNVPDQQSPQQLPQQRRLSAYCPEGQSCPYDLVCFTDWTHRLLHGFETSFL